MSTSTRMTIVQLEQMKTHELADLLANVVMVLRRMPDVPCRDLQPVLAHESLTEPTAPTASIATQTDASRSSAELEKMTVNDLRKLAKTLNIPGTAKAIKADLISKILARQSTQGHSEQYNIQNL